MKGKLLLVGVGVGIGYVLGARAGRERYEQIKSAAQSVWEAPLVRRQRAFVADWSAAKARQGAELVETGAVHLFRKVTGRAAAPEKKAVAAPKKTTAAKPAAKKPAARKPAARKPATRKPAAAKKPAATKPAAEESSE